MGVFAPDAGTAVPASGLVEGDTAFGIAFDGGAGVTVVEDDAEFAGVTPGLARA